MVRPIPEPVPKDPPLVRIRRLADSREPASSPREDQEAGMQRDRLYLLRGSRARRSPGAMTLHVSPLNNTAENLNFPVAGHHCAAHSVNATATNCTRIGR